MAREEQKVRELEKAEELAHIQRDTLEMIAGGLPLKETFDRLLQGFEAQSPDLF